ncbi:MAG: hypothetical protein J3K34DRAFT_412346 [Monoraphidium minutum]|nr:MAG: hypothetical protein J3K34DRAFT_412346 [Monoraphidium minutum]
MVQGVFWKLQEWGRACQCEGGPVRLCVPCRAAAAGGWVAGARAGAGVGGTSAKMGGPAVRHGRRTGEGESRGCRLVDPYRGRGAPARGARDSGGGARVRNSGAEGTQTDCGALPAQPAPCFPSLHLPRLAGARGHGRGGRRGQGGALAGRLACPRRAAAA